MGTKRVHQSTKKSNLSYLFYTILENILVTKENLKFSRLLCIIKLYIKIPFLTYVSIFLHPSRFIIDEMFKIAGTLLENVRTFLWSNNQIVQQFFNQKSYFLLFRFFGYFLLNNMHHFCNFFLKIVNRRSLNYFEETRTKKKFGSFNILNKLLSTSRENKRIS